MAMQFQFGETPDIFCEFKDTKSTNITSAERNKIVANALNSLSEIERAPFIDISEKDKIRYSQDVQAYFEAVQKAKEYAVQIIGEKEQWSLYMHAYMNYVNDCCVYRRLKRTLRC